MTLSVSIMSDEIRSQVAAAIVWNGSHNIVFHRGVSHQLC